MCGIAGYLNINISPGQKAKIMEDLRHRGPDTHGSYESKKKNVQLIHRRLSILDLSDSANQPFFSHDGRYVIIYNGEVFNFKELAAEYNIETTTNSDTEVIIELFSRKGVDFVKELNGMFSMAIYDITMDILYLFRDRIGIKPLYYFNNNREFAFASELKALSFLGKTISTDALHHYLYLGYIPEPYSIYEEIRKFPAGCYGIFADDHLTIHSYWTVDEKIGEYVITDQNTAKQTLKDLLHSSINYRMISDVPLGIFLSGGIDSSLVSAISQDISHTPVNTFSIGFKEKEKNEAVYAKKVANHLHTNHHEFMLEQEEAVSIIQDIVTMYDEPFADPSALPTSLVSKKAKDHVTVALGGDGGDELFMGYGMYTWADRLAHPLLSSLRLPIYYGLKAFGNQRLKRGANVFNFPSQKTKKSHIFSQDQNFFSQREVEKLTKVEMDENIRSQRFLSPAEEQSFFDIKYYLKDDLLVKIDRASMVHSLEVRVPILDHRIVEFSLNLDEKLKRRDGDSKYLLKQILYDYVPKEFFDRPKQGFSIPLKKWLKEDLKSDVLNELSEKNSTKYNLLNYDVVKKYIHGFYSGIDDYYNKVWALYILQKWLNSFYE